MSFVDGNNSGFYMPVAPAYNGGYERKKIEEEIRRIRSEMK